MSADVVPLANDILWFAGALGLTLGAIVFVWWLVERLEQWFLGVRR